MKPRASVGIIGGSGLYAMGAIERPRELKARTPFGAPSGPIVLGRLAGVDCAFLPRHGRGHVLLPGEVNNRANIYALKTLGVERVLAVTAVGSLREELPPRRFVFPDQLVDETRHRAATFFGGGVVAHVAFDAPFCADQSRLLHGSCGRLGIVSSLGGAYVCMEGPAFSTRAESEYHRRQGYDVVGMTAAPEAKLAREAELCYSVVALVTDYDCWKEGEEVTSATVIANLTANVAAVQRLLADVLPAVAGRSRSCRCPKALEGAVFTDPKRISRKAASRLKPLIGGRLP